MKSTEKLKSLPMVHTDETIFNPYKPIGNRVKICRTSAMLTVSELAKNLGITSSLLTSIEHGQVKIPSTILAQIATFTKTNLTFLLTGIHTEKVRSASVDMGKFITFISFISRLPHNKKVAINNFIKFFDKQ